MIYLILLGSGDEGEPITLVKTSPSLQQVKLLGNGNLL